MEVLPSGDESVRVRWLTPAFVALAVWGVLSYSAPFTPVSSDATRDQLLVRDCVELGRCHTAGAPTSVSGIRQGVGWIDLLTLLRLLGLDVGGQRRATLFLNGLAVATLFMVARRLRRDAAWPAALLLLTAMLSVGTAPLLINTSLDLLPEMACTGALMLFAIESRRSLLMAAAVALGMAVNFHVGAVALVPALLFVAGRASVRDVLLAMLTLAATALSTSWDAWRMNLEELSRRHLLLPGLVAAALCAVLGGAMRKASTSRLTMTLVALVVPLLCGAMALVFVEHHAFAASYLHPVLGPLCLVGGMLLEVALARASRNPGRIRRAFSVALAANTLAMASRAREFATDPVNDTWTYWDARLVAQDLSAHGVSWAEATTRLQAPRCHDLISAVGAYLPGPDLAAHSSDLAYGVTSHGAGALSSLTTWLRPAQLRVCRAFTGTSEAACVDATPPVAGEGVRADRFLFSTRMDIATHKAALNMPFMARYEIGVEAVSALHSLTVLDEGPEGCRWKVAVIRGFDASEVLPSAHVQLAGPLGKTGSIVLEKPFGIGGCSTPAVESLFLPCLKESEP